MTAMIRPAPVRKAITVDAPPDKAFDVFTKQFGRWWPASYAIGTSAFKSATIEPKAGGRWFETGEDGTECEWGEVLAWEPPSRIVLAWRIRADWKFDPALLTEVEIRFSEAGPGSTRVELEHRQLENMGDTAEATRQIFDSEQGWEGILQSYRRLVGAR
jgi:uncharacterized protein YndB with AHSA1/START domain